MVLRHEDIKNITVDNYYHYLKTKYSKEVRETYPTLAEVAASGAREDIEMICNTLNVKEEDLYEKEYYDIRILDIYTLKYVKDEIIKMFVNGPATRGVSFYIPLPKNSFLGYVLHTYGPHYLVKSITEDDPLYLVIWYTVDEHIHYRLYLNPPPSSWCVERIMWNYLEPFEQTKNWIFMRIQLSKILLRPVALGGWQDD